MKTQQAPTAGKLTLLNQLFNLIPQRFRKVVGVGALVAPGVICWAV